MTIHDIPTPAILIDVERLEKNIRRMQKICDRHGVELWPHIKTHKCNAILRRQLEAGARGMTCAKIGEAEALLESGVRQIFIAHSLVDVAQASRLKTLAEKTDRLILAATSLEQAKCLEEVVRAAGLRLPVFAALDTGLGREGCRSAEELQTLLRFLEQSAELEPVGIYTHEGHCNFTEAKDLSKVISRTYDRLIETADAVDSRYVLSPGCSASAAVMAAKERIHMIRPGAYCLGDMCLARRMEVMTWEDMAISILTTVVDRPEKELALLDAGSKIFSGDKTLAGESGRGLYDPEIVVSRVNEEHGYVFGAHVRKIKLRDRLRFVPAHVCTAINMMDRLYAVADEEIVDVWTVEARGCVA